MKKEYMSIPFFLCNLLISCYLTHLINSLQLKLKLYKTITIFMNYNHKIFTEDTQTIAQNYGLMCDVIKIMTLCDGHAPAGSCCGKNNTQIVNKFISNKKNYMTTMEQIEKRLIKTTKPGILYISPLKRMINIEMLSDQEIIKYTENGYISRDRFDWSMYEAKQTESLKPMKPVEVTEPVEPMEVIEPTETKAKSTKKGKKK